MSASIYFSVTRFGCSALIGQFVRASTKSGFFIQMLCSKGLTIPLWLNPYVLYNTRNTIWSIKHMESNINVLRYCSCHINRTKQTMVFYFRSLDEFNKTRKNMRELVVQYYTHGSANTNKCESSWIWRPFLLLIKLLI